MAADRCDLLCLDLPKAEALGTARLEPRAAESAASVAKALGDNTRLTIAAASGSSRARRDRRRTS